MMVKFMGSSGHTVYVNPRWVMYLNPLLSAEKPHTTITLFSTDPTIGQDFFVAVGSMDEVADKLNGKE